MIWYDSAALGEAEVVVAAYTRLTTYNALVFLFIAAAAAAAAAAVATPRNTNSSNSSKQQWRRHHTGEQPL